ncbi:MAG: hypothetical protein EXS32_12875 [Opitutus sp.]|nr:hypothetical protein [Opitutus sp.]
MAKLSASLLALILSVLVASAADAPKESRAPAAPFVHPGLLHTREELAFVRQKVAGDEEPWKTAWENLRASGECQESGRDQGHTQMGLGFLGCAAEIAWFRGER